MNTKNTPDVWERMKPQLRPGDDLIARTRPRRNQTRKMEAPFRRFPHGFPCGP